MRFWLSGPRIMGVRPGVSFGPSDFRSAPRASPRIPTTFIYVITDSAGKVKIGSVKRPKTFTFEWLGTTTGDAAAVVAAAVASLSANPTVADAIAAINREAYALGTTVMAVPSDREIREALKLPAAAPQPTPLAGLIFTLIVGLVLGVIIGFIASVR